MKKITILLLLLASVSVYSQIPKGFSFAVSGVQTSLKSDDVAFGNGNGFAAGAAFHWGYYETFNYQFDLLCSFNKLELPYTNSDATTGIEDLKFQKLDMVWCFNYYPLVPEEDRFYAGVQAGAFASIFGSKWQPEREVVYDGNLREDSFTSMPIYNAGATFGILAGYNRFKLSVKYNMGLTNVLENVTTDEYDESHTYIGPAFDGKLSTLTCTLYYKIF